MKKTSRIFFISLSFLIVTSYISGSACAQTYNIHLASKDIKEKVVSGLCDSIVPACFFHIYLLQESPPNKLTARFEFTEGTAHVDFEDETGKMYISRVDDKNDAIILSSTKKTKHNIQIFRPHPLDDRRYGDIIAGDAVLLAPGERILNLDVIFEPIPEE